MTLSEFLLTHPRQYVCVYRKGRKKKIDYFSYSVEDETYVLPMPCITISPFGLVTYRYAVGSEGDYCAFHMFCEVGAPYAPKFDDLCLAVPATTYQTERAPYVADYYVPRLPAGFQGTIIH